MSPRRPNTTHVLTRDVEQSILFVRGEKIILDHVLARMYGVTTKALLQAVRRNSERFPGDFMYQLSLQEVRNLRSQIVTSSWPLRLGPRPMGFEVTICDLKRPLDPPSAPPPSLAGIAADAAAPSRPAARLLGP